MINVMRRTSRRKGFTLIETLIVIAITALLSSFVLTYTSTSREQVALYVEQSKISQTILRAKSLTLSTYNQPAIPCGYGVRIDYDMGIYELFSYGAAPCSSVSVIDPNLATRVRESRLPPQVRLGVKPESIEYVLFTPPDPKTSIWRRGAGAATSSDGIVFLQGTSGKSAVGIGVSFAGQVSFEVLDAAGNKK